MSSYARVLNQYKKERQEMLRLRDKGFTLQQIANRYGRLNISTVSRRVARARKETQRKTKRK